MYYPIIDKLKELMADITSVKDKEPLIIEGTLTTQTGGTWSGSYSDILSASGNKPIYFKIIMPTGDEFFIPIVLINDSNAVSCMIAVDNSPAEGIIYSDNTFSIGII